MTPEEKEKIRAFMYLVLEQLHPNWREYPFAEMERVVWSVGEEFEGTRFEKNRPLCQAFWMYTYEKTL